MVSHRETGERDTLRHWRSGDTGADTGRIIAFTDGVFAVAITLLVLNIKVPTIPRGRVVAELPGALLKELPSIGSYLLSFVVIGIYWITPRRNWLDTYGHSGRDEPCGKAATRSGACKVPVGC